MVEVIPEHSTHPDKMLKVYELDGVGPVDNIPLKNWLNVFVEKNI